ncbi:sugar kinase [Microbacterium sp. QXD-8]|uniref:Sugar kinase n=1 Tax=Microbacterium psychrotolerans TaxID=3068321 RepID=A0ABU0YYL8_9MICO|nr:sugar kinase [Microbacterium sp. QXD-8]MDQ7876659.1 sugar kinase [Microbacterium sp. QXD-8]
MSTGRGGLVTIGETMGLFRPSGIGPGELVDSYHLTTGGAESNVAIGIARLGGTARWIGRVGRDAVGRKVLRDLRAESVEARVIVDLDVGTGLMTKEQRVPGRSAVHYARADSAGSRLSPGDIAPSDIAGASVLHVTGITPALSASASAAVDAAMDVAHASGVAVSFDVNHRDSLWRGRDAASVYRRLAARATVLFAGEDEASLIVGTGDPRTLALRLADLGPRTVIIKRGAAGAVALEDGECSVRAALAVPVIDTVGAGDAFVAGYLTEMMTGADPRACLELAVRTGAFACLAPGDWEGYPRRDELGLLESSEPVTR